MNSGYTAAGSFPWKLLARKDAVVDQQIRPIHLQLIPTNKCNGNCTWCSCRDEDRSLELSRDELLGIITKFAGLGTKAITITGGGEPTLSPWLREIILTANDLDIETGLVTNGLLWCKRQDLGIYNDLLTWSRLSIYKQTPQQVAQFCANLPGVDIGLSCVVTEFADWTWLCKLAANTSNITHIRFVHDIMNPNVAALLRVKDACAAITNKAIFQDRSHFTAGMRFCKISALKPVVGADGYVYPCCGVQYATEELYQMPKSMRLCHWRDFDGQIFDGSKCKRCFYSQYNFVLAALTQRLPHEVFI